MKRPFALGTPKIMSVNGIYAREFKDFICPLRLSARLFHLRTRGIWADLTSQLDPVIMRGALF